jgi:hypothetical protein
MDAHDIVCVHTIVGYQAGGNAAHFTTGASGRIVQARDTIYKSAANKNGNHRVVAIENEDHGSAYGAWSGSDVPGFTDEQAEAVAKILAWAHKEHGIPLELVPDSKPGRRGVAYHRQGIDPWRVDGGELWTDFRGKVCPGDRRISQLINHIIPRARVLAGLARAASEDDDMAADFTYRNLKAGDKGDMHWYQTETYDVAVETQRRVTTGNATVAGLTAAVDALAKGQNVAAAVDEAVAKHMPTAEQMAAAQTAALRQVLPEFLGEDNAEQANAIVDALVARLARTAD